METPEVDAIGDLAMFIGAASVHLNPEMVKAAIECVETLAAAAGIPVETTREIMKGKRPRKIYGDRNMSNKGTEPKVLDPKSELGKMLLVLVEEIATIAPRAFEKINVEAALRQADHAVDMTREGS